MPQFTRKYPGKSAQEIFGRVDDTMAQLAEKHSLEYQKDESGRTGKVSKMGITGVYQVSGEEVTVDLKFPMIVPGSMKRSVEEAIMKRLDNLFA